ncbi:MAG: SLBB domain-containing protein [Candidatus Rokubacteria bacterium]|nr:SLBB domain-containing protein [Candidatus Rokubacteria bacterium]
MSTRRITTTLVLAALAVLCVLAVVGAEDYAIGPRDVLAITVWGHADLSRDYPVDGDGFVPFPLVGRVKATGLTTTDLARRLTELLGKEYLVDPQVLVSVKEYLSKKIIILGEAAKPGVYNLTASDSSLLEILGRAGGPGPSAGKQVVVVRQQRGRARGTTGGYSILRVDLDRLQEQLQKGDTSGNIRLEDEDTLFIPKVQSFFVLGEVRQPGAFPLDKPTTALDAISVAQGFRETAAQSAVKVLRRTSSGREETMFLDLSGPTPKDRNVPLQEGDTIVVPKGNSFFVLGEVKAPGAYQLDRSINVLEAIIRAGGFTEKASPGRTRVMRSTPGGRQMIQVDMNDIIKRGQREKAIAIQEDDVIIVPESFF